MLAFASMVTSGVEFMLVTPFDPPAWTTLMSILFGSFLLSAFALSYYIAKANAACMALIVEKEA